MKAPRSLTDAIAAHRRAITGVYTAQAGRPLQRAIKASDDALDTLLGTPVGSIQGAGDLLAYLRWWLRETGAEEAAGGDAEAYSVARARAADLELLLFAPDDVRGLKTFAREIIRCALAGGDADGAEIQSLAITHGLLVETAYDPAVHGAVFIEPGVQWLVEPHVGDQWFVFAGPLATSSRRGGAE